MNVIVKLLQYAMRSKLARHFLKLDISLSGCPTAQLVERLGRHVKVVGI